MGLFGGNSNDATPQNVATDGQPAAMETNGHGPVGVAFSAATEGIKKRGRGRPRKDGSESFAGTPATPTAQQTAQLNALFAPEVWAPIVTLPADAMLALTGHAHWNISGDERKTLSITASTAMQYIGVASPKALALSLFAIAMMTAYLPRVLKEFSTMKTEREAKAPRLVT